MKRKILSVLTIVAAGFLAVLPSGVSAQELGICSFLGPLGQPFGCGSGAGGFGAGNIGEDYILPRVQLVLSLVFIGLIGFAIVYVIRAAIVYIQSQGNPEKIAEATKAIRSVFVGLGALFVGIAGILLVIAFFGGDASGGGGTFDVRCVDRPSCCTDGVYTVGADCP